MSNADVRVRFAPSPTGDFHVGSARTALFNYLFARHHGGKFILRIEDTDRKRFKPEALTWLLDGLRYLNLDWDEGPEVGGDYGPYIQSKRLYIYQEYCQQLIKTGYAYRCFCIPERLARVWEERKEKKLSHGYDRYCRSVDPIEADKRADMGEPHTVRLKIPLTGEITIKDVIRGKIIFQNSELQDAVIMKSDNTPTYHLANVIDDHLMKISHILRGDEWVSSLPLHLHLYDAFGWNPPIMAHLPVILNPAGKGKISKRELRAPDGRLVPVFIRSFEQLGYLPEAMVNYMALLGWSYDDKTEIMNKDELIERFDLIRVNPAPAAWNYDKLEHINGDYIRQLSIDELTDRLLPYMKRAGIPAKREIMLQITPLIQPRIKLLRDVVTQVDFFFADELPDYKPVELIPKNSDVKTTLIALKRASQTITTVDFKYDALDTALRADAMTLNIKVGQLFQPIRVAVCGRKVAPPLIETLIILGKEKTLERINKAIKKLPAQSESTRNFN